MEKKHLSINCQIHDHSPDRGTAERNTRRVIVLTAVMMAVEIIAGWRFHSMALLADGWHMGTHVAAFLIAAIAYAMARRHKGDRSFSFGTGKIDVLGGYTSAVILGIVALFMAVESLQRLFEPLQIHFNESIGIGLLGLCVNVASALLLKHGHGHGHGHSHGHGHAHGHDHDGGENEDLNFKAAYVHVIADAVTSILAISALVAGKYLGWVWLDPVMGVVGSAVVAQWSWGLLRDTSAILLDRTPDTDLGEEIRRAVEADEGTSVADLHVWPVGVGQFSAIVSIVARDPRTPEYYRRIFSEHEELRHVTIEIQRAGGGEE
jgi:cation diffusion facilitator family transporter